MEHWDKMQSFVVCILFCQNTHVKLPKKFFDTSPDIDILNTTNLYSISR